MTITYRPERQRAARRPRQNPEREIQRACMERLRYELPGAVLHHSPNEFNMSGAAAKRLVAEAKKDGMLPGFLDIIGLYKGIVFFFEVKVEGRPLSDAQKEVIENIKAQGFSCVAVIHSQDEMMDYLRKWGLK